MLQEQAVGTWERMKHCMLPGQEVQQQYWESAGVLV